MLLQWIVAQVEKADVCQRWNGGTDAMHAATKNMIVRQLERFQIVDERYDSWENSSAMGAKAAIANVEVQQMGHILKCLRKNNKIASNAFIPI